MTGADPRITLARADLAAASLEGLMTATRYAAPELRTVAAPVAALHRAPDAASERMDELILGERFDAMEDQGDFVWGQARRDGYVGFVRAADLALAGPSPTHRVAAIRTYAFAEPSIRSPALGPFSLNALIAVEAEDGKFSRAAGGGFFWTQHLEAVGVFERDAAAVAERFLGAPYLWGGRTSVGLDCSGLVQQALYACGRACPRDADQQAALGREIDRAELARGDLVAWRGHIGLMLDETRVIHANGHHMAVAIEPLAGAIARIEAAGAGAPTAFRRL
jgi:cell wall-associated NlpC family hydrolase